ncbi:unnamed protein product [Anisakis simplex]|uniref:Protein kinase domain-containing protein n=1 Tax=Anisakis simplex TaxID=6269 RepID=A0A0M3JVC3_ANISI|nr:unnamed protein product [Anisakis simplex]
MSDCEATCDSANPIVEFPIGKVVGNRWRITKRIGNGAYGAVYEAQSLQDERLFAALKVESNEAEESILKVEVEVLKQLANRPNTVRLLHSGKRDMYSYLVMTLCGPDLTQLKHNYKLLVFSASTTLRIGIHSLYAIKQIHEVGYVHRDIKPSNMAIGATSNDSRLIFLIDYGMVRKYADRRKGIWQIRAPRRKGRVDDLWSLMYMLIDLQTNNLPWARTRREDRILYLKEKTSDRQLTAECKLDCYEKVLTHLRALKYANRPNYIYIYETIMDTLTRKHFQMGDAYDWEIAAKKSQEGTSSPSPQATAPERSGRTARLNVVEQCSSSPDKFHVNQKDFPTACWSAFMQHHTDVPDISKTRYYISTGRSTRVDRSEKTLPVTKTTSLIDILP